MRGGRILYSQAELAWLEGHRMMVISDYHAAFVSEFGRNDVSAAHLHGLRKRKGWKTGRDGARYAGRVRAYNPAELTWLAANAALPITDYHTAFQVEFDRADVTPQKLHALRKRQGWKTGRTGRFAKGCRPMNKGLKCEPGRGGRHPNARRTQFKKGQSAHNAHEIGHERLTVDGYVEICINQVNPYTGAPRRYVHKHRWLWEQSNGPVPDGHVLKCLDSNALNTDPSNWAPIPRGVLARLNGGRFRSTLAYDEAAPAVKPLVMASANLKHRAQQLSKGDKA